MESTLPVLCNRLYSDKAIWYWWRMAEVEVHLEQRYKPHMFFVTEFTNFHNLCYRVNIKTKVYEESN